MAGALTQPARPLTMPMRAPQETPEGTYDAIIVDSSDPVGPAEVLFQKVGGPFL